MLDKGFNLKQIVFKLSFPGEIKAKTTHTQNRESALKKE